MTYIKLKRDFSLDQNNSKHAMMRHMLKKTTLFFFYKILISCGKGSMENEYGAVGCKLNLKEET